jgi:hypothetical protein
VDTLGRADARVGRHGLRFEQIALGQVSEGDGQAVMQFACHHGQPLPRRFG